MLRRVVVTGLGLITPLGGDVLSSWRNLIAAKSGIQKISGFDISDLTSKIAGHVPSVKETEGDHSSSLDTTLFNWKDYVTSVDLRRMDRFILLALAASVQAIADSGLESVLKSMDDEARFRAGVMIGSGIGGLSKIYETSIDLYTKGARRVSPFFIPASLINLASGHVSIRYGLKGPNQAVSTACATGANAIGNAASLIAHSDADIMVAGGSEAAISRIGIAGFAASRALSTSFNETPEEASRPWDKRRDGFVMGEGAGIVVLEEYEHAKKRGARIYGELVGYGLSGDAYHITAPSEDASGATYAIKNALANAYGKYGVDCTQLQYINAHGTSTPPGDRVEVRAIKNAFKDHAYKMKISSTKSSIGHLLGASGSVEAIFALLSLQNNICPPTLNLNEPDEMCDLDFVPHEAQEKKLDIVMTNSFGFGGTNTSLIFKKI